MPTLRTQVTNTWSVVASGRTSGAVIIDIYGDPCVLFVGSSAPDYSGANHYRVQGEHLSVALDAGENLYARTASETHSAVVVTTISGGNIGMGFDERAYLGAVLAVTTQPFAEANVKNGTQQYLGHEFVSLAQSATANVVFQTGNQDVLVKGRSISTNGDNVLYEVFRAPTVSGGTALTVHNYNEVDPVATTVTASYGATISSAGTLIDSIPIYGSVGSGNRVSGFSSTGGLERRLARNTKYLIRFTNRSTTAAVSIAYSLTWYEGTLSTEA